VALRLMMDNYAVHNKAASTLHPTFWTFWAVVRRPHLQV
jgi:hypothetical protein